MALSNWRASFAEASEARCGHAYLSAASAHLDLAATHRADQLGTRRGY